MARKLVKFVAVPVMLAAGVAGIAFYRSKPAVPSDPVHRAALILEVCYRKGWQRDVNPPKADECAIPLLLEVADQPAPDVRKATLTFLDYKSGERDWLSWDRGDIGRLITQLYWRRKDGWLQLDPTKGHAKVRDGSFPYSMGGLWMPFESDWDSSKKTLKARDLHPYRGMRWSDSKIDALILDAFKNDPYENGRWAFEGKVPPATWYVRISSFLGL